MPVPYKEVKAILDQTSLLSKPVERYGTLYIVDETIEMQLFFDGEILARKHIDIWNYVSFEDILQALSKEDRKIFAFHINTLKKCLL